MFVSQLSTSALRRALILAIATCLCVVLVPAVAARADTPTTLTVVGTSDVQDSGLIPLLIKPLFQQANPGTTLNYVSLGTGAAITYAESGQARALLVHAASLENQFVGQRYSAEPFGRAIFYGDYVLLGPANDPAGVMTNAPNDIATAFADIAAAGAAGKADFVSRGGTPGTTVQEHAIWQLINGTPGLNLCTVSAANGGGQVPSTAVGNCPSTTANPTWYHTTGVTQAPNIVAANTCTFANATKNGANDCYVLTDRGTYACLTTPSCGGGGSNPSNLHIVTRNNSATARGGNTVLINSFHAYAINPAKFAGNPNVQINSTLATKFLNFLTSPSLQGLLKDYLGQQADPTFIADAAPAITASAFPATVTGGQKITVKGTIANLVPGTPPLAGKTVQVSEVAGPAGVPIASATTNLTGAYSITFSPPSTGSYQVTTPQIQQIENATLNPVFGDILAPGASTPAKITVKGAITGITATAQPGRLLVTGNLQPTVSHVKGSVTLLARAGTKGSFRKIASTNLATNDHSFAVSSGLKAGTWFVEARFQDPGQVTTTTSKSIKVVIAARKPASVTTTKVTVKNGKLTLSGKVGPKPAKGGTVVQVLALDVGSLPRPATTAAIAAAGPKFKVIARVKVKAGNTNFTVSGKLKRRERWIIQLKYAPGGVAGTASGGLRSLSVT
jgi:tungstate transport system substrate-binding protein